MKHLVRILKLKKVCKNVSISVLPVDLAQNLLPEVQSIQEEKKHALWVGNVTLRHLHKSIDFMTESYLLRAGRQWSASVWAVNGAGRNVSLRACLDQLVLQMACREEQYTLVT